jgi:hypothetical protein
MQKARFFYTSCSSPYLFRCAAFLRQLDLLIPTQDFLLLLLLLLLSLQFSLNLSIFPNRPPLVSISWLTSPVPHVHILQISLNWLKPPQLRFSYTSSAFWIKYSELSARIQFLHAKQVSQPRQSSHLDHFNYIWFIVKCTKFTITSCSPYTIIVNWTVDQS